MAEEPGPLTFEALAAVMQTNPVVVRRTMAGLCEAGFVRSGRGHGGGWTLARDLTEIIILDIHARLVPQAFFRGIPLHNTTHGR